MENLLEKLQIVVHYMKNMKVYAPDFWENLKATKLNDKTDDYINDISDLIDEWIEYGETAFYLKYISNITIK